MSVEFDELIACQMGHDYGANLWQQMGGQDAGDREIAGYCNGCSLQCRIVVETYSHGRHEVILPPQAYRSLSSLHDN